MAHFSQREERRNDTSPAQPASCLVWPHSSQGLTPKHISAEKPAFLYCAASFPPQWEKKKPRVSQPAERKSDSGQAQCTTRALWAQEEPGSAPPAQGSSALRCSALPPPSDQVGFDPPTFVVVLKERNSNLRKHQQKKIHRSHKPRRLSQYLNVPRQPVHPETDAKGGREETEGEAVTRLFRGMLVVGRNQNYYQAGGNAEQTLSPVSLEDGDRIHEPSTPTPPAQSPQHVVACLIMVNSTAVSWVLPKSCVTESLAKHKRRMLFKWN
ncbi:hypothetical protein INR49_029542 [Caranx melampygus]|nr:hypothetical protein INR49_029542 [Caranx melampygus]